MLGRSQKSEARSQRSEASGGGQRSTEPGARCAAARPSQKSDDTECRPESHEGSSNEKILRCALNDMEGVRGKVAEGIRKVLAGDVEAYSAIYKACDRPLRSFIGSRYGRQDNDFIDEVATRTHEYALEHLREYSAQKRASFQTWLNWQSRNVAKRVRFERREPDTVSLDEELDVQYILTPSDPAEERERQRRNRVLRQELKALAEQGRLSVAGHGSGRWTFSTTARRLGLTVPKARYRYESACRELKQRLELRGVRPTEVVPCYGRVGILPDDSGDEDDRAAMPMAFLPDGPDTLAGAAAADVEKEVPSD